MKRDTRFRVSFRLDAEHDADLIAWLQGMSPGSRSTLIRTALRETLKDRAQWEPVDIDELRRVVAEEMRKVAGSQSATAQPDSTDTLDAEAKYGAKLDKMLNGLRQDK